MTKIRVEPKGVSYSPGTIFDDPLRSNYKYWDKLTEMITNGETAYCRHPDSANPTIAGANGTFNRPAPLDFTFDINLPEDVKVNSVMVRYKQRKLSTDGGETYCKIGGATVSLLGTSLSSQTGTAVSTTETTEHISFTGVTASQLNNSSFGVRIAYPKNTADTTGRITLRDVELEIDYEAGVYTNLFLSSSKNPLVMGEEGFIYATAIKYGTGTYSPTYTITLPTGLTYQSISTSGETTSYSDNTITWEPNFASEDKAKKTLMIKVKCTASNSNAYIEFNQPSTGTVTRYKVTLNRVFAVLTTGIQYDNNSYVAEKSYRHNVTIRTNDPLVPVTREVDIILTGNPEVLNPNEISQLSGVISSDLTDYDRTNNRRVFYIRYNDTGGTLTIPIALRYNESGEYSETIYAYDSTSTRIGSLTKNFIVRPAELETLAYTYYRVPDAYLDVMGDGAIYTAGTNAKATLYTDDYTINDYVRNLRLGIYNFDPDLITSNEEAFLNNVYWSKTIAGTNQTIQTVDFTYDSNYPVFFVYSHMYLEDPVASYTVYNFTDPYLVEKGIYSTSLGEGVRPAFFRPARNMLDNDDYSTAYNFANSGTAQMLLDQWQDGGVLTNKIAVRGVKVIFDYVTRYTTTFNAELFYDAHHTGNRSIYLEAGSGTASIGSNSDKWNYTISDLTRYIKNMQLRFKAVNTTDNSPARVDVSNVRLIIYYINKATGGCTNFSVDGQRSEDLGIYLQERELNMGTENEESKYHVTGTDETIINRLNVVSKKIKLKIAVPNCTIKESMPQIHEIVEMFTNNREIYTNKPILKKLIFDDMPDEEFRFARIDSFDDEWKGATYYATITLEIPDGTTYSVSPIRTGGQGFVSTSIAIKPALYVKSKVDGSCIVTESYLNQYMEINDKNIEKGDYIIIDTNNRTVTIDSKPDVGEITNSLSFESSWFRIKGNYNFESTTCDILYVEYNSRM